MRARICVAFLALALAPPALAQVGSAHGFDSGMGEGGYMGMGWHSRSDPGPALREPSTYRHYRLFRPAYPYYWDPYGGGGYLTSQWTTTPAGIRHQLWYDPAKHIYYYYP